MDRRLKLLIRNIMTNDQLWDMIDSLKSQLSDAETHIDTLKEELNKIKTSHICIPSAGINGNINTKVSVVDNQIDLTVILDGETIKESLNYQGKML